MLNVCSRVYQLERVLEPFVEVRMYNYFGYYWRLCFAIQILQQIFKPFAPLIQFETKLIIPSFPRGQVFFFSMSAIFSIASIIQWKGRQDRTAPARKIRELQTKAIHSPRGDNQSVLLLRQK